ncbi:hypothetical protein DFP73DRAFT_566647 [Morchella snyderi]|nr:hypothetical protein DFP73DRAFT_566647 [Morchella snyderi]
MPKAAPKPLVNPVVDAAAPYPHASEFTAVATAPKTKTKTYRPAADDSSSTEDPLVFLTAVQLPGEEEGEVPIYDSCDEIRRKIRAFFRDPKYAKVTQKRFREEIGNVNSNSYRRFMEKKGEGSGAENGTFTGAYIFFEKKRIYENKPKGKKRIESEQDYPLGRPLEDDNRGRKWICSAELGPPTKKEARMAIARRM